MKNERGEGGGEEMEEREKVKREEKAEVKRGR